MDLDAYREEVKFKLTGGVLDLEIDDSAIDKVIEMSFREILRYIDTTELLTVPYERCIDLKKYNVEAITIASIYRAEGFISDNPDAVSGISMSDPMYASQWQLLSGTGNLYNFQDFIYNYGSYNTLMQIRNTTSTDLQAYFDRKNQKVLVNLSTGKTRKITIEYVPLYKDVSEVFSEYWQDIIIRMSVANAKISLGRIRSRFKQSNTLWTQDGETLLSEGNAELDKLREELKADTMLCYPID